jgi:hypothetical protein
MMLDQRGRAAGDDLRRCAEERAGRGSFVEVRSAARRRRVASVVATVAVALLLVMSTAWLVSMRESQPVSDVVYVTTVPIPTPQPGSYPYRSDDALWRAEGSGNDFVECEPCRYVGQIDFVMLTHNGAGPFRVVAHGDDGPLPQEPLEAGSVYAISDEPQEPFGAGSVDAISGGGESSTRQFVGYRRIDADSPQAATPGADTVIVDTVGNYTGRIVLRPYGGWHEDPSSPVMVTGFDIVADSEWTLAAYPGGYRHATNDDVIVGDADDAIDWNANLCKGDQLRITHSEPGPLLVLGSGPFSGPYVVFDDTGPGVITWDGPEPCLGLYIDEIHADGPWTLSLLPGGAATNDPNQ